MTGNIKINSSLAAISYKKWNTYPKDVNRFHIVSLVIVNFTFQQISVSSERELGKRSQQPLVKSLSNNI